MAKKGKGFRVIMVPGEGEESHFEDEVALNPDDPNSPMLKRTRTFLRDMTTDAASEEEARARAEEQCESIAKASGTVPYVVESITAL